MSTTAIKIQSEDVAWRYIEEALEGKYDNDVVELDFNEWPSFHVNVKGDRYDSTITTSMMRSLVDLQGHLNRVYAEIIYGKSAKSLTAEERSSLEIVFKVEKGSSNVVADLSGFFAELGKNAMEKMTGKQVVTVVLGAAALWASTSAYDHYLKDKQKSAEEKNRHEITVQLIKQQPRLMEIQNANVAAYTNILKSVPDADLVTTDKVTLRKDEIENITKQERQSTELKRIDDLYLISSLKIKQDSYKIDVLRVSDGRVVPTELFKGHLSMDEMENIMRAFTNEKPISLNIVGRVRGEEITSANIVGVNDMANGEAVAHANLTSESSDI
ncbi:hypothetical protein [Microbulbifer sp. DLAB2-AA]|uniref:hypothetical protein n=1 Tax=Microbulbifer sp. DLAB2-AA TaxID=3243394 RepID=UPI004039440E